VITTNAEWDAKNAALAKKPIYVFAIGGQARVYTTHDLVREGITGAIPDYKAWLKTPKGASQSIDVLNGTSSIGELEIEVIEQNGEIRTLIGANVLEGRTATLSVGYPGIAYSNFIPLHTYQLYKINPGKDYTSWFFYARDRQMVLKKTIYVHPENGQPLSTANPWVLTGTPGEIIQAVALFALGRGIEEIDRDGLARLDSTAEGMFKTVRPFFFRLAEATEAKQFLETEICKPCGLYPVVDNTGRLSVRSFRPPAAGPVPVFTFNASNMTVLPEVDRMEIVNEVVFKIDGGNTELVFVDATSVSTYGRGSQHSIDSKGLWTVLGAQWWCQTVAQRLFRRFAGVGGGLKGGAPAVRIEAFLMTCPVWVGDYVYVTHPLMPDVLTGALGVTNRIYEVIDREPDFANGKMQYRLLDTGLTGLAPAHKWAASDRDFVIGSSEVY
jgi:hypothetical protein